MMNNFLAKELGRHYERVGNKIVFSNGMTLNQLALEMWEGLGYKEIDSSVVSRVIGGERIFSQKQLEVFSHILKLSEMEKEQLKKSAVNQIAQRLGFSLDTQKAEAVVGDNKSLQKLKGEYFQDLLESSKSEEPILDYCLEKYARFVAGDFNDILPEVNDMEVFIKGSKIRTEKRGKIWLMAISAIRGIVFSHKLSPFYLYNNLRLPGSETMKYKDESDLLKPMFYEGWGGIMRLCGEAVIKFEGATQKAFNLLTEAYRVNGWGLNYSGKTNPFRMGLYVELLGNTLELERVFPHKARTFLDENSTRVYNRAIEEMTCLNEQGKSISPQIYEFKARYNVRKALGEANRKEKLLDDAMSEVRKSQTLLKELRGKSGTIETNTAVTEVNIYKAAGTPVPKSVMQNALRLVISSQDIEQASRLVDLW